MAKKMVKSEPYANIVRISREALRHNFREFRKISGNVSPVVKTNAYGHGIKEVVSILGSEEVPFFTVDSLEEAKVVRSCSSQTPVLTIGYVSAAQRMSCRDEGIHYTIVNEEMLDDWSQNVTLPTNVHLKIDTGMYRQGIMAGRAEHVIGRMKNLKNLKLDGICTHLADADAQDSSYTDRQIKNWNDCVAIFRKHFPQIKYFHISNTAGHAFIRKMDSNLSRTGIGLYGLAGNGKIDSLVSLRPVLSLASYVSGIKEIPAGARVGYNGTFVSSRPLRIATLPVGYGSGLDRRLSNKGVVLIGGREAPIVGRISMNITTVDVTKIPDAIHGAPVTVISDVESDGNSIVSMARICDTISYDIVTGIHPFLKRSIV